MKILLAYCIPFCLTACVTPLVILLAKKCNCIDNPGVRRFHKKATPRWGGLAFFVGALPFLFLTGIDRQLLSFCIAALLLLVLGMVDDYRPLGWRVKFAGMIVATTLVVFFGDITVRQIGYYGHFERIELGAFSVPFTYIGIIGVTNTINLIDGLDGLATGTSLLGFLFMGIAAFLTGNQTLVLMAAVFAGALTGFMLYNFPKARIFMGDSGSLFLGFSLSVFCILLTQTGNAEIEPPFAVLVLLIPIFDTLRVMILRMVNRKNPFHADKSHLHHLIVRKGFSNTSTVILLWALMLLFGSVAVLLVGRTSTTYMVIILSCSLFLSLFADALARR